MPSFRADPNGYELQLDEDESGILRGLFIEMALLLDADVPREDPVVARLFPRAYDDPDEEAGYRALVDDELTRERKEFLSAAREALGPDGPAVIHLDADGVDGWLRLLTDLRLAIGTRLGVDEEMMGAEIDADAPEAAALTVLDWLGWVQGTILSVLGHDDPDTTGGPDAPGG